MTTPSLNPLGNKHHRHQRGAAMLILMLIVMLGLITLFTFRMDRKGPELNADRKTALALAQAKEALLGRAASNSDVGTLSCPSVFLNGVANTTGSDCISTSPSIPKYAGRYPWKTLRMGDLYDGTGERLWYVMSPNFIDKGTAVTPATPGTISVNGIPNVVAVIIAPGPTLSGQSRSTGNDVIMSNYVESYVSNTVINTAIPPGNDRVIIITAAEMFDLVTQRMAREFATEVSAYYAANGTYPPDNWVPTTGNWASGGHFENWAYSTVTKFSNVSPKQGSLAFLPCVGTFDIQHIGTNDTVKGRVNC
jgi:hypothetical protein